MKSSLILSLLLTVNLAAQQDKFHQARRSVTYAQNSVSTPVELDLILLGDTFSRPKPVCAGCDTTTPQARDNGGDWKDMDTSPQNVYVTGLDPVASWEVRNDPGTESSTITLDEVEIEDVSDGTCIYDTPSGKCTNGDSCNYQVNLHFTIESTEPIDEMDINIPGFTNGNLSVNGLSAIQTGPVNGIYTYSWIEYDTARIIPGCGAEASITLDPEDVYPTTDEHEALYSSTTETLDIAAECEVCPPQPIS